MLTSESRSLGVPSRIVRSEQAESKHERQCRAFNTVDSCFCKARCDEKTSSLTFSQVWAEISAHEKDETRSSLGIAEVYTLSKVVLIHHISISLKLVFFFQFHFLIVSTRVRQGSFPSIATHFAKMSAFPPFTGLSCTKQTHHCRPT